MKKKYIPINETGNDHVKLRLCVETFHIHSITAFDDDWVRMAHYTLWLENSDNLIEMRNDIKSAVREAKLQEYQSGNK